MKVRIFSIVLVANQLIEDQNQLIKVGAVSQLCIVDYKQQNIFFKHLNL